MAFTRCLGSRWTFIWATTLSSQHLALGPAAAATPREDARCGGIGTKDNPEGIGVYLILSYYVYAYMHTQREREIYTLIHGKMCVYIYICII